MTYLARQSGSFYRITRDEIEAERLVTSLDPLERRLLAGVARGEGLRAVADRLGIAEARAEVIRATILRKFGGHTTADLVRIGICAGLESA